MPYSNNPYPRMEGDERSFSTGRSGFFEKKSAPISPDCSAPESQVQAQTTFTPSLRAGKDGAAWPGTTEQKTNDKGRGLFFGSNGQSSTATSRKLATDLEQKLEIGAKRGTGTGAGTATVTKSSMATNTAPEQGLFGVASGFRDFTFSRSNPLDLEAKQPAPSRDTKTCLDDSISIYSSKPSLFHPFGQTSSTHVGSTTSQCQDSTTALSKDSFGSKPRESASAVLAREAGLAANLFSRSCHSDRGPQPDRQACLSSETVHSQPSSDTRRVSNRPLDAISRSVFLGENETASKSLRPDTLVRTVEEDNTQFTSANGAEPLEEESDDYSKSSPPIKEEPDSGDDSCSLGLASPSPDRSRRSVSTALIRTQSPGSLNVIWKWVITENRERMLPTFYWIVQSLFPNLDANEKKDGFIYAFRTKEPEGRNYLRIGWTKDEKKRIREHTRCYGESEQVYPPQGHVNTFLPHAKRVERLIHAELVQQSMQVEFCPKNGQQHSQHREWFDVDERHAIAVIRRWSRWIKTAPYEEIPLTPKVPRKSPDTKKSGGRPKANSAKPESPNETPSKGRTPKKPATTVWRLRSLKQDSLVEMCWPLDMSATTVDDTDLNEVVGGML